MIEMNTGGTWAPSPFNTTDALLDAARDMAPADASEAEVYGVLMDMLRGKLRGFKTAKGLRAYWWRHATHLAAMSENNPAAHDELLLEYVERIDLLA